MRSLTTGTRPASQLPGLLSFCVGMFWKPSPPRQEWNYNDIAQECTEPRLICQIFDTADLCVFLAKQI